LRGPAARDRLGGKKMKVPFFRPGPRNLITDVAGLAVGNAQDEEARTGVTVLLCEGGAVAAAELRGGAPGTRELDLLRPECLVERIDALVLAGGSAHGLAAADGAMQWLAARGRGFPIAGGAIPIVPAAILFDLGRGGRDWTADPPHRRLALEACEAAGAAFALGNAGAGAGALAGRLKGGLGSASLEAADFTVGALVAANPVGSTVMTDGTFWAWPFERDGEFGGRRPSAGVAADDGLPAEGRLGGHTTLAIVATDATLSKAEAQRVAIMAHDGLARAIRPVHTPFDGDVAFAVATGRRALPEPRALSLARLGSLAADCLARSVERAVWEAEDMGSIRCHRSVYGEGR
jgi:L-aminopeptidase/D-esterase-like protein